MPFDFGNHPARLGPASRLIGEIGMEPTHLVGRPTDRPFEKIADLSCRTRLAGRRIAYLICSTSINLVRHRGNAGLRGARQLRTEGTGRTPVHLFFAILEDGQILQEWKAMSDDQMPVDIDAKAVANVALVLLTHMLAFLLRHKRITR